jgi:cob(I)alamin adenosyltransferase
MTPEFKHPLARRAKVWSSKTRDGVAQPLLVIVTTLALDDKDEDYRKKLVDKLDKAASDYVAQSPELAGFVLVNRPKEWGA